MCSKWQRIGFRNEQWNGHITEGVQGEDQGAAAENRQGAGKTRTRRKSTEAQIAMVTGNQNTALTPVEGLCNDEVIGGSLLTFVILFVFP